jgi:hypothetical protein
VNANKAPNQISVQKDHLRVHLEDHLRVHHHHLVDLHHHQEHLVDLNLHLV